MAYLLAHLVILLFPGLLIAHRLVPDAASRLVVGFAVSYSTAVYSVLLAKWLTLSLSTAIVAWLALSVLLLLLTWFSPRPLRTFVATESVETNSALFTPGALRWFLGGAVIVIVLMAAYQWWAGPYLEVPTDVLAHLIYSQSAYADLLDGQFAKDATIGIHHDKAADYWYYLHATLSHLGRLSIGDSTAMATLANVVTFIVAGYALAHLVFKESSNQRRTLLALLTCVFFVVHFGTGVFAFIRYYALAPVMLNMVVFYGAMALILALPTHRVSYGQMIWLVFLMGAAALVHTQEVIFIAMMSLGLWGYYTWHFKGRTTATSAGPQTIVSQNNWRRGLPVSVAFISTCAGLLLLVIYVHITRDRLNLYVPRIIALQDLLPFVKHLYILNPTLQFYKVVTVFGLYLIVLFVIYKRYLTSNAYLTVGLLSPLFTVFNPVFVDLFTRFSGGHTLWRLCFLIPLPFLAAWMTVQLTHSVKQGTWLKRLTSAGALVVMFALLWPFQTQYLESHYSRLSNLTPVNEHNSVLWLNDVVIELTKEKQTLDLITDPVTGYVLSAMTPHRSMRRKFFTPRIVQLDANYLSDPDKRRFHKNDLIVINQRNGADSPLGTLSGHWPNHILTLDKHYDPALLTLLNKETTWFESVWNQDQVHIYKIR